MRRDPATTPRRLTAVVIAVLALAAGLLTAPTSSAVPAGASSSPAPSPGNGDVSGDDQELRVLDHRYLVALAGQRRDAGFAVAGTDAAVSTLVETAGGTIVADMSDEIGVLVARSSAPRFAQALQRSPLVATVGNDFGVKMYDGNRNAARAADPLESEQWDMKQISTRRAHAVQDGVRRVDVGVLDSGTDGQHPDFTSGVSSNVDCARGRDSLAVLPPGVAVGNPDPCIDNQFHGTHVSGTIGAQANGLGMVGVAPGVTLVPVKVCDASGYCYVSPVVDGIRYSGKRKLDVINMSFFVDDNAFQESTEFKCSDDPMQRTFRTAVERALAYARDRGVTPVAALGNSDQDLSNPVDDDGNPIPDSCRVVPSESPGVVGTAALGARSEQASYSNYGFGETDVAAPGGNGGTGDCETTVLSTFPDGAYGCIQGTSMASPHAAGVAALIVSEFGRKGTDGDMKMAPRSVVRQLEATTVDIGRPGYDKCFGHGRVDAMRAVRDLTRDVRERPRGCPEYGS